MWVVRVREDDGELPRVREDDGELRSSHYIYVYSNEIWIPI